jgi:hypothetical protein
VRSAVDEAGAAAVEDGRQVVTKLAGGQSSRMLGVTDGVPTLGGQPNNAWSLDALCQKSSRNVQENYRGMSVRLYQGPKLVLGP